MAALLVVAVCWPLTLCAVAPPGAGAVDAGQTVDRPATVAGEMITFAAALESIAKQGELNILADDAPVLQSARIRTGGTCGDALDLVGVQFDYSWSSGRSGDVLLRKRFESADERPFISRELAIQTAERLRKVLISLGVTPSSAGITADLRTLYSALAPSQRAQLVATGSLLVRDLSTAQQLLVRRAIVHSALGPLQYRMDSLLSQLRGMDGAFLEFGAPLGSADGSAVSAQAPPFPSRLVYVWQGRGGTERVPLPHLPGLFVRISSPRASQPGGSGTGLMPPEGQPGSEAFISRDLDERTRQALHSQHLELSVGSTSVSDLLARISDVSGFVFEAPAPLGKRPITAFLSSTTALRALEMLCELNAWEWHAVDEKRIRVDAKTLPRPRSFAALVAMIREALPLDWQTFLLNAPHRRMSEPRENTNRAQMLRDRDSISRNRQRLSVLASRCADVLVRAVKDRGDRAAGLAASRLTQTETGLLAACLALDSLALIHEAPSTARLLTGQLLPMERNPESAAVTVKDGVIGVRFVENGEGVHRETGFSAPLAAGP